MTGMNHVSPGHPLEVVLSPAVTMTKVSVGPMDNNAYLLRTTDGTVLIDAAHSAGTLIEALAGQPVPLVITTHAHGDHWQALAEVARSTGAELVAGRPDVTAIADGAGVTGLRGVWDGDRLPLGPETLEVVGLVGHTPGSITLAYAAGEVTHLFTGDSLFPGGPGRTRSADDFGRLMDDLEDKIFGRYDDATVVHPGHGDDTTLGAERPQLGGWRARGW